MVSMPDYLIPGANGPSGPWESRNSRCRWPTWIFIKQVLPSSIAAAATDNHATVIASIIGGRQTVLRWQGIANGCSSFFPSSFSIYLQILRFLNANNVAVETILTAQLSSSFTAPKRWVMMRKHGWYIQNNACFSAGNRQPVCHDDGKYANITGFANLTGNFKMAKNIITVGPSTIKVL